MNNDKQEARERERALEWKLYLPQSFKTLI